MTAIVGVLSRKGIAFAADSAATVTSKSGQKITHHANKLFSLSKYQPVGIAIYNNLNFLGIPWDSIIKMYRNSQGDKKYNTVSEYVTSFWTYIKKNILPSIKHEQDAYLREGIERMYAQHKRNALADLGGTVDDANKAEYFAKILEKMNGFVADNTSVAQDYKDYKIQSLEKNAKSIIDEVLKEDLADALCPSNFRQMFVKSVYTLITYDLFGYWSDIYTGLVFFGYGEKELLPACYNYHVNIAMEDRIKYSLRYQKTITTGDASVIIPFAQTDVANTVIRSVEDGLRAKFYENYKNCIVALRDEVVTFIKASGAPADVVDKLNALNVDYYTGLYKDGMDNYIQKEYIEPLVDTVAFLSKEDLAELVESLVKMTCLKRRITKDNETVGGPVDVAVVTKGDGFIWMKRKHYFDPELNQQFFERYKKN